MSTKLQDLQNLLTLQKEITLRAPKIREIDFVTQGLSGDYGAQRKKLYATSWGAEGSSNYLAAEQQWEKYQALRQQNADSLELTYPVYKRIGKALEAELGRLPPSSTPLTRKLQQDGYDLNEFMELQGVRQAIEARGDRQGTYCNHELLAGAMGASDWARYGVLKEKYRNFLEFPPEKLVKEERRARFKEIGELIALQEEREKYPDRIKDHKLQSLNDLQSRYPEYGALASIGMKMRLLDERAERKRSEEIDELIGLQKELEEKLREEGRFGVLNDKSYLADLMGAHWERFLYLKHRKYRTYEGLDSKGMEKEREREQEQDEVLRETRRRETPPGVRERDFGGSAQERRIKEIKELITLVKDRTEFQRRRLGIDNGLAERFYDREQVAKQGRLMELLSKYRDYAEAGNVLAMQAKLESEMRVSSGAVFVPVTQVTYASSDPGEAVVFTPLASSGPYGSALPGEYVFEPLPTAVASSDSRASAPGRQSSVDSIVEDYKTKYQSKEWYQAPEKDSSNPNKVLLHFPNQQEMMAFAQEQAANNRPFIVTQDGKVVAYSDGDGKLRHSDGREFKTGDPITPSVDIEHFLTSRRPAPRASEADEEPDPNAPSSCPRL